jgi:ComF family protein
MPLLLPDLFQDLLALFYPTLCLACDEPLVSGEQHFCTECRVKLPYLTHHLPDPVTAAATSPLARRFWGKVEVHHTLAYLQFAARGRVQRLLHRLKYDDQPEIGQVLGRWFGAELEQTGYAHEFDALVPVPMHPAKERRRGYNQATCYAEGLAGSLGVPVWPTALRKLDDGGSQTRKNRLERWQNVSAGFTPGPEPERLVGKRLLLVDDVLTTGATLEACANVLLAAGAQTVSVCTIASAGF